MNQLRLIYGIHYYLILKNDHPSQIGQAIYKFNFRYAFKTKNHQKIQKRFAYKIH